MDLDEAKQIAEKAHRGQVRWGSKEPYVNHPMRVSAHFKDKPLKIVAVLHDVLEDTPITSEDLLQAGFSKEIVTAIEALSKKDGETYLDFILRAADNPLALKVKLADIEDNLRDLSPKHKIRDKYLLARYILINITKSWADIVCEYQITEEDT